MKNKKGFTLVEILAVIVVLAIIGTVGATALMKTRKVANIKTAEQLEKTITKIGPSVYSHEFLVGNKTDDAYFYKTFKGLENKVSIKIALGKLKDAGYLKNDSVKIGNDDCKGYLEVTKDDKAPKFQGYVSCGSLYETKGYDESNVNVEIKLTSNN